MTVLADALLYCIQFILIATYNFMNVAGCFTMMLVYIYNVSYGILPFDAVYTNFLQNSKQTSVIILNFSGGSQYE